MTIKEQILRLLNKSQSPMTNREIARKLKRPEPSIRRATRMLDEEWKIREMDVHQRTGQIYWGREPIFG